MPKGPRGEKRPADTIGCAVNVAMIATGEMEDDLPVMSGRVRSGKAGGMARKEILSENERSAIARRAASARWEKEAVMTACEQVREIYDRKRASGLVDAKFYVGNAREAAHEIVCQELLSLEKAIEDKKYRPLVFNDSYHT